MKENLKKLEEKLLKEKQLKEQEKEKSRTYAEEKKIQNDNFIKKYRSIEASIIRKSMSEIEKVVKKFNYQLDIQDDKGVKIYYPHIVFLLQRTGVISPIEIIFVGNYDNNKIEIRFIPNKLEQHQEVTSHNIEDVTEELISSEINKLFKVEE